MADVDLEKPRPSERGHLSLHMRQRSPQIGYITLILVLGNLSLLLYSHLGLSAEIMSNIPPEVYTRPKGPCTSIIENATNATNATGCTAPADMELFETKGKMRGLDALQQSCFPTCGGELFGGGTACAIQCCVQYGYSTTCSTCIALNGVCVTKNCIGECIANSTGDPCRQCNADKCTPSLVNCTEWDLPVFNASDPDWMGPTLPPTPATAPTTTFAPTVPSAAFYGIPGVGQISFVYSVTRAWDGNAKFLAFVVVLFSGIWPYAKNLMLFAAWFVPMAPETSGRILNAAVWAGRFSLLDVFAVMVLNFALDFRLVGGAVAIICEARPAIVAFGIVAVWALIQAEWMLALHTRVNPRKPEGPKEDRITSLLDLLTARVAVIILTVFTTACVIIAIVGTALEFTIVEIALNQNRSNSFTLATVLTDTSRVDFPTVMVFIFCVLFPLCTCGLSLIWVLKGQPPALGHWLLRAARMCCLDVFFIAAVVFGSEFKNLIPALASDVNPCYELGAAARTGFGLVLCAPAALLQILLSVVIQHKLSWSTPGAVSWLWEGTLPSDTAKPGAPEGGYGSTATRRTRQTSF